jgi:hypothetical protein
MSTSAPILVNVSLNFSSPPSLNPDPVTVHAGSTILYALDSASVAAGYRFSGYVDNTPGTGSQLSGTSIDGGKSYQLSDVDTCPSGTAISVTLFIRNNNNPAVRFSYDPEIVNNR